MTNTTIDRYALVRFNKKTGKIDRTMTAIGKGLLQLWALDNTPKSRASVLMNLDTGDVEAEFIGDDRGLPLIIRDAAEFRFHVPAALFDTLSEQEVRR